MNGVRSEAVGLDSDQRAVALGLARRRVYLFTMFFFLVGTLAAVGKDTQLLPQLVDFVTGAILLAGFVVIGVGWRRQTPAALRRQHNILMILTIALVFLLPLNPDLGRALFTAMLLLNRLL